AGKSRVTVKPGTLAFDDLAATVAGIPVRGRLMAELGTPVRIDGGLDADAINVPDVLANAVGAVSKDEKTYSPEPFAAGFFDVVRGRVRLAVSHGALTPGLAVRQSHAEVRMGNGEIAFEDIDGELASGHLTGAVSFRRLGDGVAMHGRLALADADAAA